MERTLPKYDSKRPKTQRPIAIYFREKFNGQIDEPIVGGVIEGLLEPNLMITTKGWIDTKIRANLDLFKGLSKFGQ